MTMLRFTKFIDKVLDHTKKRTVRKKRKCNCGASIVDYAKMNHIDPSIPKNLKYKRDKCICQIEKGDKLQVYIMVKMGEATVTNVQKLDPYTFSDEDAQLDGFKDYKDFEKGIGEIYGDWAVVYSEQFHIIDFDPHWKPQKIVDFSLEDFAAHMTKDQWVEFMKEDRDQPREWPPKDDKEVYLKHKKGFD